MPATQTEIRAPASNYVHGYAATRMLKSVQQGLIAFRKASLPVDLRIDRALISAAVDLCLATPALTEMLQDRVAAHLQAEGLPHGATPRADDTTSVLVLIKRSVKQTMWPMCVAVGATSGTTAAESHVPILLVSYSVDLLMRTPEYHEAWVNKTAEIVQWEVKAGFYLAKFGT
jgi:hypothetical protein